MCFSYKSSKPLIHKKTLIYVQSQECAHLPEVFVAFTCFYQRLIDHPQQIQQMQDQAMVNRKFAPSWSNLSDVADYQLSWDESIWIQMNPDESRWIPKPCRGELVTTNIHQLMRCMAARHHPMYGRTLTQEDWPTLHLGQGVIGCHEGIGAKGPFSRRKTTSKKWGNAQNMPKTCPQIWNVWPYLYDKQPQPHILDV